MNESAVVFWAAFGGGAAAGFIVLAVELFKRFLDRPLVKVSLRLGNLIQVPPADPFSGVPQFAYSHFREDVPDHIFFDARNPHTKPVVLSNFGLRYKRKEWRRLQVNPAQGYQFPYKLDGGSWIAQWTSLEQLFTTLRKAGRVPSDLKWVWFESASGELFRSKIEKRIIQDLEKEFNKAENDSKDSIEGKRDV